MADFYGNSFAETITGTNGDDYISGAGGSDSIFGDAGNDVIDSQDYTRSGADVVIDGGDGDDTIRVYTESDYYYDYQYDYYYGDSRVLVVNDLATAEVHGGDGNDDIDVRVWTGSAEIYGGEGDDTIRAYADQDGLTLTGGTGNDSFEIDHYGSLVDTEFMVTDFVAGAAGEVFYLNGLLDALESVDYVGGNPFGSGHYELVQVGADVQLVGHADPGGSDDEAYVQNTFLNTNVGDLVAENFAPALPPDGSPIPGETVLGTTGQDVLDGGLGDDVVKGFTGDDDLNGAAGHDSLYAGAGDDQVRGGSGNDLITGARGDDEFSVDVATTRSTAVPVTTESTAVATAIWSLAARVMI